MIAHQIAEILMRALVHFKFGPKKGLPWTPQRGIDLVQEALRALVPDLNEERKLEVQIAREMDLHENPHWDMSEDDLIFVDGRWAFPNSKTDLFDHVSKIGNQIRKQSGLPPIEADREKEDQMNLPEELNLPWTMKKTGTCTCIFDRNGQTLLVYDPDGKRDNNHLTIPQMEALTILINGRTPIPPSQQPSAPSI
jgi:hypothetical protein